jgi:hypothetical protein
MAVALPFVMAGMQVLNAVSQSNQIKAQGKHQQQVAYANAVVARKQGDRAMSAAASRGQAKYREGQLRESRALAVGAQSGLGMSESFIGILSDIGSMSRYNAEVEIYGGKSDRQAKFHEGAVMEWQGDAARQQAKAKAKGVLMSGIVGAMGSLYGGLSGGGGGGISTPGNVATSMRYGTNIGSQQTAMLASQDAGLRFIR